MRAVVAAIAAAAVASACCLGPVVLSLVGAGALGAAATRLEPLRPLFLGVAAVLLGSGFYAAYRPAAPACTRDGGCAPSSRRTARVVVWLAAILVALLVTFPYYVSWFV
jgi:mercuric ion transport protein